MGYLASQVAANRSIHRYLTNSPPTQYSLCDIIFICQIFQEVGAFLQYIRVVADSKSDERNINDQHKKGRNTFSRLGGECFRALAGSDRQ